MKRYLRRLVLFGILFVGRRGSAQDSTSLATTLSPGDIIRLTVWRHPEFSGEFPIGSDGAITHPLFRVIKVAGVPLPTVESRVRAFLSDYEQNPAFVIVALQRIYVGGEVRAPNMYSVPPGTTIAQAVALAGGPTEAANRSDLRVWRQGEELKFDLTQPTAGAFTTPIASGDQIAFSRSRSTVRDVIAPLASVTGLLIGVASLIVQSRR